MTTKRPPLDFDAIKNAAVGSYVSTIFPSVGISLRLPANNHQPCPLCGGSDRFRCDDKRGEGTWICNQCGAGNGFMLVQKYTNSDVYETNQLIASALGIDGTQQVTEAQRQAWRQEQQQRESAEREAKRARRIEVAQIAVNTWEAAKATNDDHPYLVNKRITGIGIRQDARNNLVIPMYYYNTNTQKTTLVNIQSISTDGNKLFLKDGLKKGTYCPIGADDQFALSNIIFICEGYATGVTIFEAMGYACPVIVAFDAGNLLHVAPVIRAKYPSHRIIICADNDHATAVRTGDNVGISKAIEAAAMIAAEVTYPEFTEVEEVVA